VTVGSSGRDGEIEAFVVDRYLESLLARRPVATDGVPAELGATAHRLAAGLPRYHPSFRFEERLAAQLAAAASRIRAGELVELPVALGERAPDALPDRPVVGRPVVIGGVLTSAALSLAGAAFVAWRRSHPAAAPMSRAVRSVARTRPV
jgi:hypothetical protein